MSTESNTIQNTLQHVGDDIRNRFADIASRVRAEAQHAKDAVGTTLQEQREFAAETLSKAGKRATHLTRRYPIPIFAAALVIGFMLGRIRR